MKHLKLMTLIASAIALSACGGSNEAETSFWRVENGSFVKDADSPSHFIGTNFWYGPILASEGRGGDRDRLAAELDSLHALGLDNLRILVGGQGPETEDVRIRPSLQLEPETYNDTLFVGLDYLLAEMAKRDMSAVLYLNNSWEWSGGYGMYLEWAGAGKAPVPARDGYNAYTQFVSAFVTNDKAKELFANHVEKVLTRVNSVTGKPYTEDPTIFAWQISNEPRCFSDDPAVQAAFKQWIWDVAAQIKSLDPNHMVCTGTEGSVGCQMSIGLFEDIHSCPDIDYLNIHIWPYNWSWARAESLSEDMPNALARTDEYIAAHLEVAERLNKPVTLEEFGFPRDNFEYKKGTPVTGRDAYYKHVLGRVVNESRHGGKLAGANFWGWAGLAGQNPENKFWKEGDDYSGDPAQEHQGLNSVYLSDKSTISIIEEAVKALNEPDPAKPLKDKLSQTVADSVILFGHQDALMYGHAWRAAVEENPSFEGSDVKAVCGSYPAVLGLDLGGIELGDANNLDGNDFTMMRKAAQFINSKGGVVTLSWHPRNPLTGGDAWDVSSSEVVKSIAEGGEKHDVFMTWLGRLADYLETFTGEDGKVFPMIFRPWHEHTGSWFWWGKDLCTREEYIGLWKQTFDYLVNERGLDMLVWAYSPNMGCTKEEYMERYPGDGMVDMLGLDAYEYVSQREGQSLEEAVAAADGQFIDQVSQTLGFVAELAASHDKLMALTECGLESVKSDTWWTGTIAKAVEGYPCSYLLVWRNASDKPEHFYGPHPESASAEDFKAFAASGRFGFVK